MPRLAPIAEFLDALLDIGAVPDYSNALNGVQFANSGEIDRVASAVDFSGAAIAGAVSAGARLLLVHHGMFWGGTEPITGHRYRQMHALLANDIAVYSVHLPLDIHPVVGNNALLARRLGLEPSGGFARYQTIDVGLRGHSDIATSQLAERAKDLAAEFGGALVTTPFEHNRRTRIWGICTGSGADSATLREASARQIDTLIVGEGPHHTAVEARERGIVVLYAGHYATETLGIRALGDAVADHFGLTSQFIDAPTGL